MITRNNATGKLADAQISIQDIMDADLWLKIPIPYAKRLKAHSFALSIVALNCRERSTFVRQSVMREKWGLSKKFMTRGIARAIDYRLLRKSKVRGRASRTLTLSHEAHRLFKRSNENYLSIPAWIMRLRATTSTAEEPWIAGEWLWADKVILGAVVSHERMRQHMEDHTHGEGVTEWLSWGTLRNKTGLDLRTIRASVERLRTAEIKLIDADADGLWADNWSDRGMPLSRWKPFAPDAVAKIGRDVPW